MNMATNIMAQTAMISFSWNVLVFSEAILEYRGKL
jgi:hypothetical protein